MPDPAITSERSPLLPPASTILGRSTENGPAAVANPDGALNVQSQSTPDTPQSRSERNNHVPANQSLSRVRGVLVTFALGCLVFILATNMSLLTTTQSAIAEELHAFEQTTWFTSTYLIAMSSLGPINGKLSAIFSPRSCIFVATIFMAIGALICAKANSFEAFIAGRAVAGVGASGIFTVSIIIVLELTGSRRKGIAIGLLNSGYTFGVAVGATAAGALLDVTGWRGLFWLQIPVVILAGIVILVAIPSEFTTGEKSIDEPALTTWDRVRQIDYLGAAALTTSLLLILYALSSPKKIPVLPIILSVIIAAAFVLIEVYIAHDPVIPVSLLKSRGLCLTCLGTVGFMMARWSVLFYTPTYAIAVRQWSPSIGGALLIPTNGGFAVGGILVGWLHIRRQGSFFFPTIISYACFPVTLLLLALLSHREGSPAAFVLVLFACGFATGAALNYNLAHLLHITPKDTHYVATALIATFRGFAGSFGSAIGGGLFTRTLSTSLKTHFAERGMQRDDLVRRLLGLPKLAGELEGMEREVAKQGYEDGIKTLWLAAALLALAMVFVQAGVGWRGYEEKKLNQQERQTLPHEEETRE